MNTVEQVYPDLFIAKHEMRQDWFCSVLVFLGKNNIGIVDTGFIKTINDIVFPFIVEQGRSIDEIDLVVNTHRDGDHIKGNQAIKEQTDTVFAAHRLEAEAIPETNQLLDDGDTVNLGDRSFKVIHTPGHRPDRKSVV